MTEATPLTIEPFEPVSVTFATAGRPGTNEVRAGSQDLTAASEEGGWKGPHRALRFQAADREAERQARERMPDQKPDQKGTPLTRALRSHQLWLTITYFGLLVLIARGLAG